MRKVLYMMGQLSDDDLEWMMEHGAPRQLRPGDILIRQGQPIDALYIVLEGALSVTTAGGEIARLGAGEIIGEISFVDARPPATTVTAAMPAVVFALDRERLRAKLERDAWFAARFYRSVSVFLAARLRNTVSQLGYAAPAPRAVVDDDRDEIDDGVLDNVHLAGARFDRMLKRFVG
jgi:CRP-like cAMP-binding protein